MEKWNLIVDVVQCNNCANCSLAALDEHVGNDFPGYAAAQPKDGKPITLHQGRYGPYVTDGRTNASIPKTMNPDAVTYAQAEELLAARRGAAPAPRRGGGRSRRAGGGAQKSRGASRKSAEA